MQEIERVLSSSQSTFAWCNGSAIAMPAENGNGNHLLAQARDTQQASGPDVLSNGCSHATSADEQSLKQRRQSHDSAQV